MSLREKNVRENQRPAPPLREEGGGLEGGGMSERFGLNGSTGAGVSWFGGTGPPEGAIWGGDASP